MPRNQASCALVSATEIYKNSFSNSFWMGGNRCVFAEKEHSYDIFVDTRININTRPAMPTFDSSMTRGKRYEISLPLKQIKNYDD